jgi:hypothetical protein
MDWKDHYQWLSYLPSDESGVSDTNSRREALQYFLQDPERACQLFPSLKKDLVTFFSQSSNPHKREDGSPISGREDDFAKWEAAHRWAAEHNTAQSG